MGRNASIRTPDPMPGGPRAAKPGFDGLIVVCAKCLKRQGLGGREFGRSLRRAFKRRQLGRKLKVVETGCLGPCPKRMLAVATPAAMSRGQVQLLDPAPSSEAIDSLLVEAATKPPRPAVDPARA